MSHVTSHALRTPPPPLACLLAGDIVTTGTGDVISAGDLTVAGTSTFVGDVDVSDTTDPSSSTDVASIRTAGGVAVAKNAFIGGVLTATGEATVGSLSASGNINIDGDSTFVGNVLFQQGVTVNGAWLLLLLLLGLTTRRAVPLFHSLTCMYCVFWPLTRQH